MHAYIILTSIMFAGLTFIWKYNDPMNFFLKVGFMILSFWGFAILSGVIR